MVRVWLPDRPGALGQVASRIGAVHGDVIGIDILERGGGSAIDELTVVLPEADLLALLVAEIGQVDGVAVEHIRQVDSSRPDAATAGLRMVAQLLECASSERVPTFAIALRALVEGDWCAVVRLGDGCVVATDGCPPDLGWLSAFLEGSRHLDGSGELMPSDIVWTYLDNHDVAVASGRSGRPFHDRERAEVALVGRIVAALPAATAA